MRELYIKYIILAILFAHFFYQCNLIPAVEQVSKMFYYLTVVLLWIKIDKKYGKVVRPQKLWTDNVVKLLWISIFISIFNSCIFSDQSLFVGLMASLPTITAYVIYFLCKKIQLEKVEFEKIIFIISVGYIFALFVDLFSTSNPIFGYIEFDIIRGVRFRMPGMFFSVALFLMSLNKYVLNKKKVYILYAILGFLGICALLARQSIIYSLVFGFLILFRAVKLYKKVVFVGVICLLSLYVIPKLEIYQNLLEVSKTQLEKSDSEDDIRMKDYNYFLLEHERSVLEYAFGCGVPSIGNSSYGNKMEKLYKETGMIPVDAGWAGFVLYFGFIPTFILLLAFIKSFIIKLPADCQYIKYLLVIMFLTSFAGGAILFQYEIVLIMISFYLVFSMNSSRKKLRNL